MAKKVAPASGDRAADRAARTQGAPSPVELAALAVCARFGNKPDELLEILHEVQHQLGYIPDAALPVIANAINRSRAEVHGVVTFYHDYKRAPQGQHTIKICRAEACQAMGTDHLCQHAERRLRTPLGGTSPDGMFTIEQVFCLGNCALSPAVMVGERLYGKVDAKRFDEIVASYAKEAAE
jgi:formate dehydrogenase subunit gamma